MAPAKRKHKSPFDPTVWADLEPLHFRYDPESYDERLAHWTSVFDKHFHNGETKLTPPNAYLILGQGWYLMFEKGKFGRARELAEMYFAIPGARSDKHGATSQLLRLGTARILDGDVEGGIQCLDEVLSARFGRTFVRCHLGMALGALGAASVPDDRLRRFSARFLEGIRGQKSAAARALSATSNGELIDLLEASYVKRLERPGYRETSGPPEPPPPDPLKPR